MKAVSFSFQLSIVLRLKRTTAHKVKPAFVLRSKWLNIRNFMRDMLLVISSFLLQYSYGVRDRTDKENLASRETQRKTHLSVCDNVVSSISKLLTLSHWLFLKIPVWWFLAQKLDLTLVTMAGLTTHTCGVSIVKCIIFHFQSKIIYLLLLF